jgi:putative colanic acid biosynthesis acetyltransferase WcaF
MSVAEPDSFTGPSFSLGNRVARVLWNACWLLLIRFSPRPFHAWRAFILRLFGARLGRGVHIYPRAIIWAPWNLEVGDETGVADGAILYNQAPIRLGRRVVISQGAHLCTGTHDYEKPGFPLVARPISAGDHAWIAAEAFIHPGINIGEGAVVGARSVVTHDLPPWMVCAGHPCEPLKPRRLGEKLSSTLA